MTKYLVVAALLAVAACGAPHDSFSGTTSSGGGGDHVVNTNPCNGCAQDLTPDGNVGGNVSGGQVTTSDNETEPSSDNDVSTSPDPIWG